jgi:hypothetical protein
MVINEGLETLGAKIKKFLSVVLFLVFGETVLGLRDFEFAFALQCHEADAEVSSACGLCRL